MKISLIAGSALLLSLPVSAQNMLDFRAPKVEAVEKCSVERRHANDPFTWFNSNMCEKDWNTWQAEHPSHPFYKDKYFWMGTTVIGAAVALDAASTSWGQGQKPPFIENNPLLGKHPSNAKLVGSESPGSDPMRCYTYLAITSLTVIQAKHGARSAGGLFQQLWRRYTGTMRRTTTGCSAVSDGLVLSGR